MEENTMSKNDVEESRSTSDGQGIEPSAENGQKTEEFRAAQAEESSKAESGAVRSRSSQTNDGRTGSRRTSQAGAGQRTGSRRTGRSAGEGGAGSRRASRSAGEGGAGSRRASRSAGEGGAGSRRVSRSAGEDGASRRISRSAGEGRAESRRVIRTTGEGGAESRRVSRNAGEGGAESRQVSRNAKEGGAESRQADNRQRISGHGDAEHRERREKDTVIAAHTEQNPSGQTGVIQAASLEREESRVKEREKQTGKFGLGHKKTRRSPIVYLFEDIADGVVRAKNWCVKNYRTSIPAAICIVLVIVVACILVRNFRMQPAPVSEDTDGMITEQPLEQDAYEHVNRFFEQYYEASALADVETYTSMRSYTDETERIRMQKKANYIDYYQNLSCYTKPGPVENSYLVYVYYEVKFRGINTPAPGLNTFYLCTNDAGELYIFSGEVDQNVTDYMRIVSTQEDVKDLFNRVKVMYNNTVASDEELKEFLSALSENLKNDVKLALKELEEQNQIADNTQDPGAAEEPTPTPEEPEPTPEPEPQTDRVMTTERVNVRSSSSAEATKVATVAAGTQFTRYESLENGWSRIDYQGTEAYIKTEYLQVIENVIGTVRTVESVNIRASASEDATKLGTVSAGTTLDLIEDQENGWSRIMFNGTTAYVKTEFLEH